MTSLDFLYYTLAIGFVILISILSFAILTLALTLIAIKKLINKTENITKSTAINNIRPGILSTILGITSLVFRKGGVRYGTR